MTSVAILGGGVGGLSAAHELAKRGFDVTVYEARADFGGKARSIPVPKTAVPPRGPLPGEHGFRFFPGFYQHLDQTMKEIPYYGRTVKDNLRRTTEMMMAQIGDKNDIEAPSEFPFTLSDFEKIARFMRRFAERVNVPLTEYVVYFNQIINYLTACDARRLEEIEVQSWWEYSKAEACSPQYQKFFGKGMTRMLVAARAEEMSARTGCAIISQLMQDMASIDAKIDRVLDGPTTEMWIKPWVDYLEAEQKVKFRSRHRVAEIHCAENKITKVTAKTDSGERVDIEADYFVSAIPVEKLRDVVRGNDELLELEPRLRLLDQLVVRWMTGAMFYLDVDVPVVNGHIIFLDSTWALTAISQKQFWEIDLENRGDGRVKGVLSVDISDWDEGKGLFNGKLAKDCTEDEILDEVWAQILAHIDGDDLKNAKVLKRFLDPGIRFDAKTEPPVGNDDPLLINTADSWKNRPCATTDIPNFFIASDFVRTNTDLATMEGANEAARRAVNGILEAERSREKPCHIFDFDEPLLFAGARAWDDVLWKLGHRGPRQHMVRVDEDGNVALRKPD